MIIPVILFAALIINMIGLIVRLIFDVNDDIQEFEEIK
jgi:hypothetical protein